MKTRSHRAGGVRRWLSGLRHLRLVDIDLDEQLADSAADHLVSFDGIDVEGDAVPLAQGKDELAGLAGAGERAH